MDQGVKRPKFIQVLVFTGVDFAAITIVLFSVNTCVAFATKITGFVINNVLIHCIYETRTH